MTAGADMLCPPCTQTFVCAAVGGNAIFHLKVVKAACAPATFGVVTRTQTRSPTWTLIAGLGPPLRALAARFTTALLAPPLTINRTSVVPFNVFLFAVILA